ncbi:hypothetical protein FZEAL_10859 [Fusarium zealandicum]|uniref:Aminoglycoside phosphotransferase domain-containing protein n=1 Tax=Fusarium zealandicum TaxID=1053134 RepID=A0A8H4TUQ8_9HYPO|nr:hypothetical protein FZEAL_10859 [Fusarium zealandicum]
MTECQVRDSVRQIDEDSWLIANEFIICRQAVASFGSLWGDNNGYHYTVIAAPYPTPATTTLPSNSPIQLVHDAGDASAVWAFGGAFLKFKLIPVDMRNVTKEVTTLKWLAEHGSFTFAVPKVLHYMEEKDRSYLLISRVEGEVLADVWRTISEEEKLRCASRIFDICRELSSCRSNEITGIDGAELPDTWLSADPSTKNFQPQYLQQTCEQMGMHSSTFYMWHNDLGPYNIIIDRRNGSLGLIDWEMAGYVPLDWIRTKFGVSWAMDFAWPGVGDEALREWRSYVERRFAEEEYPEVKAAWRARFNEKSISLRSRSMG